MSQKMLIINPGSTSTKVALFEGEVRLAEVAVSHDRAELARFDNVADQFEYRTRLIEDWIESLGDQATEIAAVIGRGAPLKPLEGGSYEINEKMLADVRCMRYSNHASNLGPVIAHHLGDKYGIPSLISDPSTVDNFIDIARVSGVPEIERKSRLHALNIKEVCRREAHKLGKTLHEVDFVAVHMGGGVSVAALRGGQVIDVNDALLGMGPFSFDRAGAVPIGDLVRLCYSGKFTEKQMLDKLSRQSGLVAYLGSADLREVERMIQSGDDKARLYFAAMAYQIAKEIGAAAVCLHGKFEAIVLTGGMAHSRMLIDEIAKYVGFLGRIVVVAGEYEMEALAAAGLRFLTGREKLKKY
ncbi:MAG: butyrate kinase [Candidatus Zixiibacteriota bacterium]|nr:MAG: butyrate kinase [candidate division Zixibacteria bacterium]